MAATNDHIAGLLEQAERMKLEGRHVEAIAVLEQILVDDPANVAALEEVADNELSLEHYDRATAAARRAVEIDATSYTGHYILGFVASLREDWTVALTELQEANRLKSNDPEILRSLGWTLFHAEQRVQGIVTLERALNLDPQNPLSLCDLGVCYLEVKNLVKAHTLLSRALELDPSNKRARECVEAVERLQRGTSPGGAR